MGRMSRLGNRLYEGDTSIDFVGRKWLWYAISAVIMGIAVTGLLVRGLNFGIDFQGGIAIQVRAKQGQVQLDTLRSELGNLGVGEVTLQTVWPRPGARPGDPAESAPNNASVVLVAEVGGVRVLLTGDVEPEAQRDLLARGVDLRADVLKVPHHGSDAQEPAFLDAVGAAVSLTSVGGDNTYGHPSARTLEAAAPRSLRTDQDGDLALTHRGGRLAVVPRGGAASPG